MQFADKPLSFQYDKKMGFLNPQATPEQYYHGLCTYLHRQGIQIAADEFRLEQWWYEDDRPYYLVYPNIVPVLTRLDLTQVECRHVLPQRRTLLLRFAQDQDSGLDFTARVKPDQPGQEAHFRIYTILLVDMTGRGKGFDRALSIWICYGEEMTLPIQGLLPPVLWSTKMMHESGVHRAFWTGLFEAAQAGDKEKFFRIEKAIIQQSRKISVSYPVNTYHNLTLDSPDLSVIAALDSLPISETASQGIQMPRELVIKCLQLAVTVMMLDAGDTNLLEPDLIRKDEDKLKFKRQHELTEEELTRYQEKAKKRGKFGWHLGRQYHREFARTPPGTAYVVPPHPMHFWVGKGRERCIYKTRKGWVGNREQVEKVPTGYEGPVAEDNSVEQEVT